jgi:divalent metal cation (Fe/Co/Zn/Cd) transporter
METHIKEHRAKHVEAGIGIEYLSIGWTTIEAVVGISAGLIAGSVALVGFGLDSVIEIASSAILLWRLKTDANHETRERNEALALKGVGWCFIALAAYVGFDAVKALVMHEVPDQSFIGMALAIAAVIVMPLLARAKRRAAAKLQSAALNADSRQSAICAYLSAILMGGLTLNALFHWWWADPLAALVMVPIIVKEGLQALRGKACCDSCGHQAVLA